MTGQLDHGAVLEIIERIYASASEPETWSETTASGHMQSPEPGLNLMFPRPPDAGQQQPPVNGFDQRLVELYLAHYHASNPYERIVAQLPDDFVSQVQEAVARDWLLAQPFCHESQTSVEAGTLHTDNRRPGRMPPSRPDLENTAAELLRTIGPHVQRALQIASRLARTARLTLIGQEFLDRLAVPSLVVDAHARILATSASADIILHEGHRTLRATAAGGLRFQSAAAETAFQAALAAATVSSGLLAPSGLFVEQDGHRLRVVVLPLAGRASPSKAAGSPLALVQIGEAPALAQPETLLRSLYGLTRAEAALARRIAAGESVRDVAGGNGVAKSTVRNQLQAAMQKLNVHRQAELVAVVVSLTPRMALET
jgi:DNA-binding CsgD family transcriptional regulator